jgi:hypothetical protein
MAPPVCPSGGAVDVVVGRGEFGVSNACSLHSLFYERYGAFPCRGARHRAGVVAAARSETVGYRRAVAELRKVPEALEAQARFGRRALLPVPRTSFVAVLQACQQFYDPGELPVLAPAADPGFADRGSIIGSD